MSRPPFLVLGLLAVVAVLTFLVARERKKRLTPPAPTTPAMLATNAVAAALTNHPFFSKFPDPAYAQWFFETQVNDQPSRQNQG